MSLPSSIWWWHSPAAVTPLLLLFESFLGCYFRVVGWGSVFEGVSWTVAVNRSSLETFSVLWNENEGKHHWGTQLCNSLSICIRSGDQSFPFAQGAQRSAILLESERWFPQTVPAARYAQLPRWMLLGLFLVRRYGRRMRALKADENTLFCTKGCLEHSGK